MKKVSIIVPAYNTEQYIEKCANSVLHQTLKDIEILFIDDGSTDNTGIILDKLVAGHTNAQVVHQKNKGLYKSREIGLSLVSGEYVGWVDSDDYVEPQMYETLYNAAINHESELVICDYLWGPGKNKIKGKWFREFTGTIDTSFVEQNSQVWNKIVKRDLMTRLDIGSHFESCYDEIYIRVLMEAKNPVTINQPLYHYRLSKGTMSSSYTNVAHYRGFVKASEELRKVMQPVLKDSYWKDYFDNRVAYYLLATMIVAANAGDAEAYENNLMELQAMTPAYNKNQHFWIILKRNFGGLKALLIGKVIPSNYKIAHFICKMAFR